MNLSGKSSAGQLLSRYGLLLLTLVLIITFSIVLPHTFPTSLTARSILDNQATIAMLALAEMLVVIVGEFDLSVGYMIGLWHIVALGLIVRSGLPWPLAVAIVLAGGLLVGLLNGVLVHVFKIDSFIATLGVGTLGYAASNWYTEGEQISGDLSHSFTEIYSAELFGVPAAAIYVILLAVGLWALLEFTPTGRYLYALGGNRKAAEITGIRSRRYVIGAFAVAGLIVAFSAVVLASRLQIGTVSTGPDFLLPVFVGAMLGSTTLKPGRPNAFGTLVAVLLLGVGIAGLQQLGGTYFIIPLFNGSTLILGVGLAGYASRRIRRARPRLSDEVHAHPDPVLAGTHPRRPA